MINKLLKLSLFILALVLLLVFSFSMASAAEAFGPNPLQPQLSSDGKTLYNAIPPIIYRVDPNPSPQQMRIPAPFNLRIAPEFATATFPITYVPDGGTDVAGYPCTTFSEEAKTALNAAAAIWGNIIQSPVPITIRACWSSELPSDVLGGLQGLALHSDFPGAPLANTWYVSSLANALAGGDLEPIWFDMNITFTSDNVKWYYGTDGATPSDQFDLMTVALHEMAHGLGFLGSMQYSSGEGGWGLGPVPPEGAFYPVVYDRFTRDGSGNQLINTGVYPNPSTALGTALTSDNIWFHGGNAMAANGGLRVKLYAPSPWKGGSSYSHLDYDTFKDTINKVMVYAIASGESVHDPGPIAKGLLKDLGWESGGQTEPASFCVSTAAELQTALTTAQADGTDDILRVVQGTYLDNFVYSSNEKHSITLEGGYTAGCASRVVNAANTVLNGGGDDSGSVLYLYNSAGGDISVDGFTMQNGGSTVDGGGLFADSYSYIYTGGTITITRNTFAGNSAKNYGGGVRAFSRGETGSGQIVFTGNTIRDNAASYGGGVYAETYSRSGTAGSITLAGNTITGNGAVAWGGAEASSHSYSGTAGNIILINNIITGNAVSPNADGCGVDADSSSSSGTGGTITLTNNTIVGNISGSGGVAYLSANSGSGISTINCYNNIFWGNTDPANEGKIAIVTWNAVANGFNNNYASLYGTWNGGSGGNIINADPKFVDPGHWDNNGTPGDTSDDFWVNGDYHLRPSSLCIDAGTASAPELSATDFEGDNRIIGSAPDIGADEFNLPPQTIFIRPNAAGDETNVPYQYPVNGSHYDKVDEPQSSPDDDSTSVYNSTNTSYRRDLYNLENPGVTGTINWIKVWVRSKYVYGQCYARTALKTGGTVYEGPEITLTTSYANYSTQYLTNPKTGAPWTLADLNALQAGVSLRSGGYGLYANSTQVYVEVNYTPGPALPTVNISANPATIVAGSSSTLTWTSNNATSCSIDHGIGTVNTSGSIQVSPTDTTTYTITASGTGGTAYASTTVTVTAAPSASTVQISANPATIQSGGSSTLTWSSTNATSCTIDQGIGPVNTSGSITVSPTDTTTYTITASGTGGTAYASTTITVTAQPSSQISLLLPNAAGDETNVPYQYPASGSHYGKVGDEFGADDDSTSVYNSTNTNYRRDLYNLSNFAVMFGGMPGDNFGGIVGPGGQLGFAVTINWIKVWVRSKYVYGQCYAKTALKTGGTVYEGPEITLTDSYTNYSTQYLTNPKTGAPWTVDDINALQAGVSLRSGGYGLYANCTQVYVEVNYTVTAVSISASPTTIQTGESSTLTWSSTNATSCSIDQGIGDVNTSGSITVSPTDTTTYTITATGAGGTTTASTTVTVTASTPVPTVQISANPATIVAGASSTLSWSSTNATSCTIDNGVGDVNTSGSITVSPTDTTTYTITASGAGGTAYASTTITVTGPLSSETLILLPNAAGDETNVPYQYPASGTHYNKVRDSLDVPDDDSTSVYSSTNTNYYRDLYSLDDPTNNPLWLGGTINWIRVWVRSKYVYGQCYAKTALKTGGTVYEGLEITLTGSYTDYSTQYLTNPKTGAAWTWDDLNALQAGVSLRSGGYGLYANCTQVFVEVNYTPGPPLPTLGLSANPGTIAEGESSVLSWNTQNATSCDIQPGIGTVGPNGSITVSPTVTTTYIVTAYGPGGTATGRITIIVISASGETLILDPNAAGDETSVPYQYPVGGSHYDKVDDPIELPPDDDSTSIYNSTNTNYRRDLYNLYDVVDNPPIVFTTGTINWIKVWVRSKYVYGQCYAKTALKTGGTVYDGQEITLTDAYANYATQYLTNPKTGAPWTWNDINALQAGVSLRSGGSGLYANGTQVYVEVNYTPAQ